MRIFIASLLILLIGLFFVSGCASTNEPETKEQEIPSPPELPQETQTPEPQQAGSEQIPTPPALPKE